MTTVTLRRTVLTNSTGEVLANSSLTEAVQTNLIEVETGLGIYVPPRYLLYVYDLELALQYVLDFPALLSLTYEMELNATSPCVFSMPATDNRAGNIERDWFVEVQRHNGERWVSQHTYMVKLIERIREQGEDGESIETYVFGGLSLEDLLAGRIVDPDDDPDEAGGYSTKSGAAESVMHEYVTQQAGSQASDIRQIPNWTHSNDYGRGQTVGFRERHSNLLELLQRITEPFGIDFRVLLVRKSIQFTTSVFGTNRSKTADSTSFFIFSERRGNLSNAKISRDYRTVKNYAYILGPGEGEYRTILVRDTVDSRATPYARREFIVDAGNTEAGSSLEALTEGERQLNAEKAQIVFEFDLVQNNISRFDVNWTLGDIVTVLFQNFEQDLRVMKVSFSINETVETITPTLREFITL